jgi:hypothetical protein
LTLAIGTIFLVAICLDRSAFDNVRLAEQRRSALFATDYPTHGFANLRSPTNMKRSQLLLMTACLLIPSAVFADSDVRDFEGIAYAPNNTAIAFGYFRHTSGADTKGNVSTDLGGLRGTYILRYGGLAIIPFDVTFFALDVVAHPAPTATLHGSGVLDPEYFPTIAYVIPEGLHGESHTVIALNPRVTIPVGTYDKTALINAGENRVNFKLQAGIGQRFAKAFTLEVVPYVAFHGSNSDFVANVPTMANPFATANVKETEKPDFGLDAHVGADMSRTFFAGVSYYYKKTGEKTIGGMVEDATSVTTNSIAVSFGIRLEKETLLLLQLSQQFGNKNQEADRFAGIRISHVFVAQPEPSVPQPRKEAPEAVPQVNPQATDPL